MSPSRRAAGEVFVTRRTAGSTLGAERKCQTDPGEPAGLPDSGRISIGSGSPIVKE